jgi:hypothetical protein
VASNKTETKGPTTGRYGSGVPSEEPGRNQVDLGPRGGEGSTVEIPGQSAGGADVHPAGPNAAVAIDDYARLGANTRLYLSAEVPKLIVEIDAVEGFAPSAPAVNALRSRLGSIADKPRGIEFLPVETFSDHRSPWTESDLLTAEKRNRDRWSSRDAIVLYLLYVDGTYADGEDALGVAFNASSYAVFAQRLRETAATPLVPASAIEQSVVVHEMGHVLALVNIGYESPRDHEDVQHPTHSNNANSVMYWAIDNVGVANLFGGRTTPPTNFDADDRADLEDLKTGRLRSE